MAILRFAPPGGVCDNAVRTCRSEPFLLRFLAIHMTLVYLTLAWLAGITLGYLAWTRGITGCAAPHWPWAAAASVLVLALLAGIPVLRRRSQIGLAGLLLLAAVLGAWRYQALPIDACPSATDLAYYHSGADEDGVWATVDGIVAGYPVQRDTGNQYLLRVDRLAIGGQERTVSGDLLVQAERFPAYAYGDRVRVAGYLQTPPRLDDFDYRAYLARQGIYSLMRRAQIELVAHDQGTPFWTFLYGLRGRGVDLINRILPEPAAALAAGMLLGVESGIAPALYDAFNRSGTSHVIVISGSNIALFSGVLLALAGRLIGKRRAVLPVIVMIVCYVLLVGANGAALRAGMMGVLYVGAIAFGRESTPLVSLFASALLITLVDPRTFWDTGSQLSFAATLGLILFARPLQAASADFLDRHLTGSAAYLPACRQVAGLLAEGVVVTLAAQATALPVVVYTFGRLSLISLVANALILPAQPPLLIGGMLALGGGALWEPLGRLLGVVPWLCLTYTTFIARLCAAAPLATLESVGESRALVPLYYALLGGTLALRRLKAQNWPIPPLRRVAGIGAAVALSLWLALGFVAAAPDGRLHVLFLPVEGGEAAIMITPGGRRVWIWDGKGDAAGLASAALAVLGGWRTSFDLSIGATADEEWPVTRQIEPAALAPGTALQVDEAVRLVSLATKDEKGIERAGWAFTLSYGNFRLLLPAALSPADQAGLVAAGEDLRSTALKLPAAGTGCWPAGGFLAATAPQLVLWPDDSTYPPEIVGLLRERQALRVPAGAALELTTDGTHMWLARRYSETWP